MRSLSTLLWVVVSILASACAAQQEIKVLTDFGKPEDLKLFEFKKGATLRSEHATGGGHSAKIAGNEYLSSYRLPGDWSAYQALELECFLDAAEPVGGSLLIGDTAWKEKNGSYWNRHNGTFVLTPGQNTVSIPVNGLFRGEAGSRNNDLKTNIDPKKIIRLDFGFHAKGPAAIYLNSLRLVKENCPAGVLAFDFGPENQMVFPGFTPVSEKTVYGQNGAKAGLQFANFSGSARDDTFPTRLYQTWIEMNNEQFIADLPNGAYRVWLVYCDGGYWGGEQCHHHKRWVEAQGRTAYTDDRGAGGPTDYLFRFENVEPKPGDSVWDLYMADLFKPHTFDAVVADGKLRLAFHADAPFSSKVAALIIYPAADAAAAKWVAEVEARNRKEFEQRAVFLGPKPQTLTPPPEAQAAGLWVGHPALDTDVTFCDPPGAGPAQARVGAPGMPVAFTFAVRPLKKFEAPVHLTASALKCGAGTIPPDCIDIRYVQHALHRGFNGIAYTIGPESLRRVDQSGLKLEPNLTRQFWITVTPPPGTPAGTYTGSLCLEAGQALATEPLTLEVMPVTLDEPEFLMGFYGFDVPPQFSDARRKADTRALFTLLKASGMNLYSGGPQVPFSGLDEQGRPKLDFARCDEFFQTATECGFHAAMCYGGPGMVTGLHDGYVIGATGDNWVQKTGKPFPELLKIVWGAVQDHATRNNWPKLYYGLTDEPRVLEQVTSQLELMRAYREAVPFVNIGGSYSVNWKDNGAFERGTQDIFKTLNWSALNAHGAEDLAQAKALGKELLIYNQGSDRNSFGIYQWAEMRKGVRGRVQWHLLALHGYQFFDLDGREPDFAMINWGRTEIIPTLHLARCREGAYDFRLAVTLWNLAQKKKDLPAAQAALKYLEDIAAARPLGQKRPAAGEPGDEEFRNKIVQFLKEVR